MHQLFLISPLILQTLIWPFIRPLFWFFLHLEIRGTNNLPPIAHRGNGVIFAVNHGSELDPILVPATLPFLSPLAPMFYASRESEFYKNSKWRRFFYGGLLFRLWGSHALHPGHRDYGISLSSHLELLRRGKSLCMFPDGRKTSDEEIGSIAHGGVGYLAWRTGAAVVPVRISDIRNTSLFDFFLRRRQVSVTFGIPLRAEELFSLSEEPTAADFRSAAARIMDSVRALGNKVRL